MSCIRISQSMMKAPVSGGAKRVFQPGEQYEWQGVTLDETKPCSCGSGSVVRQYAVVTIDGLDYNLDWDFVKQMDCFSPEAELDFSKRLNEIGDGSSYTTKPEQPKTRNDDLALARFKEMAKFNLRRPDQK